MTYSKFGELVKNTICGFIALNNITGDDIEVSPESVLVFHMTNAHPDKHAMAYINDPHYVGNIYKVHYNGTENTVYLEVLKVTNRAYYDVFGTDILIKTEATV